MLRVSTRIALLKGVCVPETDVWTREGRHAAAADIARGFPCGPDPIHAWHLQNQRTTRSTPGTAISLPLVSTANRDLRRLP